MSTTVILALVWVVGFAAAVVGLAVYLPDTQKDMDKQQ